ncbi:MAG: Xaa-Pro peptidase family protein [Candidatus Promineifilaceae bacterium]|nr:Xaa-Pro peptidase family protein [Candidatus Promineifilaceae bacterium]
MNKLRLNKLQEQLTSHRLNGVALVPGPNMLYISDIHCHLSERPIVLFIPAKGEPAIIIPTLEAMKAQNAGISDDHIFDWNDQEGYAAAFQGASKRLALKGWAVGVEALHMRVLELDLLQQFAPGITFSHAEPIISQLRSVKDETEITAMEKAILVAEKSMHLLLPRINIGMSEKQIAAMLTQTLLEEGAESIAFGPIVASGPNSASPHAVPTNRSIQPGDLLVIDWGVYVDGYPSDITRTFAVGEIDGELRAIYEIVSAANARGKEVAKPGVRGQDVDRAARQVIQDAGYGANFFHRTGHGLGLEVHEEPNMVEGNLEPLRPGNVFTVEPGIYLAGYGGVRIEDNVLITADGSRSLTSFPRELITVG